MNVDCTYRKYKIGALRTQNRRDADNDALHAESVTTAPYTAFTGVTLRKGAALATEIENYRRRVSAVLNFFESIAPHWWEQLHRFNGQLVKRRSKSADMLLQVQTRLKARLSRLTTRMVIPAAAAVITIEERDTVSILPTNLFRTATDREKRVYKLEGVENTQEMLRLSYSIARRLGEVERAKQQMILYAEDWINFDGRDFSVRAQRIALLTKNIQFSLIERFQGVQALITHYYRRRVDKQIDKEEELEEEGVGREDATIRDPKRALQRAFHGVTAASLNATNPEILRIIGSADLALATDPALSTDFIQNYAPNMVHTHYSITSGNDDDGIAQRVFTPAERQIRIFNVNEASNSKTRPHNESYQPKKTPQWLTKGKKSNVQQGSSEVDEIEANTREDEEEEDLGEYVIDLEEATTAFQQFRETTRSQENRKSGRKLLDDKGGNWILGDEAEEEEEDDEEAEKYLFPAPPFKQKSSSTIAATSLINRQSFGSFDTREDSQAGADVTAGDFTQAGVPASTGKASKAPSNRFSVAQRRPSSHSASKVPEVAPRSSVKRISALGSDRRKAMISPIPSNMPVEDMINTNFRSLLQHKKTSMLRRASSARRLM